jgi:hypothetical protein
MQIVTLGLQVLASLCILMQQKPSSESKFMTLILQKVTGNMQVLTAKWCDARKRLMIKKGRTIVIYTMAVKRGWQ